MTRFLLVCLGGAAGSGLRYLVALGVPSPYGTLLVNVAGSFAMGLFVSLGIASPELRLTLTTGLLGGFTTYSAFNQETLQSFRSGTWPAAVAYVAATLVGCLAAGWAGAVVGAKRGAA